MLHSDIKEIEEIEKAAKPFSRMIELGNTSEIFPESIKSSREKRTRSSGERGE
jgi:hypothetical protein